jgi:mannitol-1-/sugar-/sorbitol-6-phosphatase
VARVWRRWAQERGFDPESVIRRAHGRPSLSTIRELLPNADHEMENREVERREIEDLEGVFPLPGTATLLAALPPECWTIVTSCTRVLAEVRLRAAGLPVPARFITSSDVVKGKPHPEPFLKAAHLLGLEPRNCVVVEDAPAGIRAGKAAGARVIGFPSSIPEADLREAGADWIVQNCAAITIQHSQPKSPRLTLTL